MQHQEFQPAPDMQSDAAGQQQQPQAQPQAQQQARPQISAFTNSVQIPGAKIRGTVTVHQMPGAGAPAPGSAQAAAAVAFNQGVAPFAGNKDTKFADNALDLSGLEAENLVYGTPAAVPPAAAGGAAGAGAKSSGAQAGAAAGSKFCPQCSTPAPASANFCSKCGTKLT